VATRFFPIAAMLILAIFAALLLSRWARPSDLYEKDQPHTLAYTADMVLHGRLALPRDELFQPATKPPLVNWLSAAGVALTGNWSEPVLKWPIAASAVATMALTFWATRRLTGNELTAALAAGAWLCCPVGLRLTWLMRPDMLQAALLTGAWWAATLALQRREEGVAAGRRPTVDASETRKTSRDPDDAERRHCGLSARSYVTALMFWVCVGGAALTKGPAALLPIVYALVLALVLRRSLWPLRPVLGLAAVLGAVGLWLAVAWWRDPGHVRNVLLGAELVQRLASASPDNQTPRPFYMIGLWFAAQFLPWSIAAVAGVALACRRRSALTPVAIWLVVVLVGLSLPAGKRIDYLLPALVPGGILAAWVLVRLSRWFAFGRWWLVLGTAALAFHVGQGNWQRTAEAQFGASDAAEQFVHRVRQHTGGVVLVLVRGKHPLATLLGEHPGDVPTLDNIAAATWLITDHPVAAPAVEVELLPIGFGTLAQGPFSVVGLYRVADVTPTERAAILRHVTAWGRAENPYRDGRLAQ
jgi:4-amino-4-deoxy-L-arabinose transferase-like glycosyltransferase